MINQLILFFERLAENMGIEIRIPRPSKELLKISFVLNLLVAMTSLVSGIVFAKKWLSLLGGMSLVSVIVLSLELNAEESSQEMNE